jgi:nicotinate-nucleotide pyrophosphorylase (carboxylating)
VNGPVNKIIQGERIALNCFIRCCSIATLSKKAKDIAIENNFKGLIVGTRKTTY